MKSYLINIDELLDKNICFYGQRESGKTTLLKKIADSFEGPVVVIDSAVQHPDKSLLIKLLDRPHKFFESPSKNRILNESELKDKMDSSMEGVWPEFCFDDLMLFDVSKYLESSHQLGWPESVKERNYYKILSNQVIVKACLLSDYDFAIITDEIEFTGFSFDILTKFNDKFKLFSAVHDLSGVSPVSELYDYFFSLEPLV